jgi:L-asparaginase
LTADKWATPFDLTKIKSSDMPKVEIAYAYSGTGAGGVSKTMGEARSKAIKENGVIFVSTTHTGSGSNYASSEGIIAGDNLNAAHARILLELAQSFSSDFNTIKGWFDTYGSGQVTIADK